MSQFLLSVFCRAENNRFYLRHGVEVRPGFTGKWIEFTCLPNTQIDDIIQQMRQRFLKPCLEQKAAIFDKEIMSQKDLRAEQIDIENQIRQEAHIRHESQEMVEHREVAEAVMESNPNDYSDHDVSRGLQYNSQAAMSEFAGQTPGLPPAPVYDAGLDAPPPGEGTKKKKGRRKKNKNKDAGEVEMQNYGGDPS